jgi:hypothetical protein
MGASPSSKNESVVARRTGATCPRGAEPDEVADKMRQAVVFEAHGVRADLHRDVEQAGAQGFHCSSERDDVDILDAWVSTAPQAIDLENAA